MADIGLQLQNTIADYIAVGGAVLFNETLVNDDPNVVIILLMEQYPLCRKANIMYLGLW